jgi:hypothetical protein
VNGEAFNFEERDDWHPEARDAAELLPASAATKLELQHELQASLKDAPRWGWQSPDGTRRGNPNAPRNLEYELPDGKRIWITEHDPKLDDTFYISITEPHTEELEHVTVYGLSQIPDGILLERRVELRPPFRPLSFEPGQGEERKEFVERAAAQFAQEEVESEEHHDTFDEEQALGLMVASEKDAQSLLDLVRSLRQ